MYSMGGWEGREGEKALQHGVNSEYLQTSMSRIAGRRAGDIWKSKHMQRLPLVAVDTWEVPTCAVW